mmetsp:Transcript_1570/g.3493  ORF Transcript_1570/g.3493 Transcript_1570/m.3493 type:complete len:87 (+) Transcript_1570:886-1146(+)
MHQTNSAHQGQGGTPPHLMIARLCTSRSATACIKPTLHIKVKITHLYTFRSATACTQPTLMHVHMTKYASASRPALYICTALYIKM